MLESENYRRYQELIEKERLGTITDDEYDEKYHLEQDSLKEDCAGMSQLGI